jgi:hypothetical protein
MNADEYKFKLEDSLNLAVLNYLKQKEAFVIRNYPLKIDKVERVFSKANLDNIKLHTLLSGNPVEIVVEGSISLWEKKEDGSRGREVSFWIRPAIAQFDLHTETFKIIDISGFLPLDFVP